MQVVRNSLADISRQRESPKAEDIPAPTEEKKPPAKSLPQLSYGANKKYPHLSKAIEVCCPALEMNLLHDDRKLWISKTKSVES